MSKPMPERVVDRYVFADSYDSSRPAYRRVIRTYDLQVGERRVDPPARCPTCGSLIQVRPCRGCAAAARLIVLAEQRRRVEQATTTNHGEQP